MPRSILLKRLPRRDLLTVAETARRLACAPSTIYLWLKKGLLPARRLGPSYLIRWRDVRRLFSPRLIRRQRQSLQQGALSATMVAALRGRGYVPVSTAARRLGVSRQTVYTRAAAGKLKAKRVAGGFFVNAKSLQRTTNATRSPRPN